MPKFEVVGQIHRLWGDAGRGDICVRIGSGLVLPALSLAGLDPDETLNVVS